MSRVLTAENVSVYYKDNKNRKKIVDNVSFEIEEGEILGLIGESGCGKTTLCKAVLGMLEDVTGRIDTGNLRPQMIFQDPYSSLNPVKKIGWILEEPLRASGKYDSATRKQLVNEMLEKVGLDKTYASRKPGELSGGQRQRVAIAVALITKPKLVIADEPVSALDVTIAAQIMRLMIKLQKETGVAYLFISHDMDVIYQMCDRVLRMKDGKLEQIEDF